MGSLIIYLKGKSVLNLFYEHQSFCSVNKSLKSLLTSSNISSLVLNKLRLTRGSLNCFLTLLSFIRPDNLKISVFVLSISVLTSNSIVKRSFSVTNETGLSNKLESHIAEFFTTEVCLRERLLVSLISDIPSASVFTRSFFFSFYAHQ